MTNYVCMYLCMQRCNKLPNIALTASYFIQTSFALEKNPGLFSPWHSNGLNAFVECLCIRQYCRKTSKQRLSSVEIFFHISVYSRYLSCGLNHRLSSKKPTDYLLHYGDLLLSYVRE